MESSNVMGTVDDRGGSKGTSKEDLAIGFGSLYRQRQKRGMDRRMTKVGGYQESTKDGQHTRRAAQLAGVDTEGGLQLSRSRC